MTDYWLNKLIFDLQEAGGRGLWMEPEKRREFIERYQVSPGVARALADDDFVVLQPLINPYLMRNFLLFCGLSDEESKDVLHAMHDGPQPGQNAKEAANG